MYKKILVPLDGSEMAVQALPFARRFAEAFGAAVELLRATDPAARPPFWPPHDAEYLKAVRRQYFPEASPVTATEAQGEPARLIIERAQLDPACLIVMATHGMSGLRRWLLGSVAVKVAQRAANPLLLIRPAAGERAASAELDTAFVPLDGSALAERALPQVIAVARALRLEAHLLRVYTAPVNSYVIGDAVIPPGPTGFGESLKDEASAYLEGKVQEFRAAGLDRVVATVVEGDAASEIIEIARATPKSIVVMSTHGRSGVGRWLLGSVAERVVQYGGDPVLLLRAG